MMLGMVMWLSLCSVLMVYIFAGSISIADINGMIIYHWLVTGGVKSATYSVQPLGMLCSSQVMNIFFQGLEIATSIEMLIKYRIFLGYW